MRTNASLGREDILKALRESRALLDAFGVSGLSLFGSFARMKAERTATLTCSSSSAAPFGCSSSCDYSGSLVTALAAASSS